MTDTYYYIWFVVDKNGIDVSLRKRVDTIPDGDVFAAVKRVIGGHGLNASRIKSIEIEKVEVQKTRIPLSSELTARVKNFIKSEMSAIDKILEGFPVITP